MADGALRTDVLAALRAEDVTIEVLPGDSYRLSKGEALLRVRMLDTVSRTTVAKLERRFGVSKARCFPALKVVQMDLPKAAGQSDAS